VTGIATLAWPAAMVTVVATSAVKSTPAVALPLVEVAIVTVNA
jgi:hypothetical protein